VYPIYHHHWFRIHHSRDCDYRFSPCEDWERELRHYRPYTDLPPPANFTITFFSRPLSTRSSLLVSQASPTTGYVASPGFDAGFRFVHDYQGWANVTVPKAHGLLVSFPVFNLFQMDEVYSHPVIEAWLELTVYGGGSERNNNVSADNDVLDHWRESNRKSLPARVYHNATRSHLFMDFSAFIDGTTKELDLAAKIEIGGFKMLYSFHLPSRRPVQNDKGLFNCSVDFYLDFSQHLHCNLEVECQGGQDETGKA
jgi:hypothetical protein